MGFFRRWVPKRLIEPIYDAFEIMRRRALSMSLESLKIRNYQKKLLEKNYSQNTRKLIIFLTPGFDLVNGGILSVSSIFEETKRLKHIHGAETLLCTYPGDPPLLKYSQFENDNILFCFSHAISYFSKLEHLLIHIPENIIPQFLWSISCNDYLGLRKISSKQINILIQNIEYLPSMKKISKLRNLGELTCTTAHKKYSTIALRNKLGFPLHHLSVFVSPEKYYRRKYNEKEDLMIISPDSNQRKKAIINSLAQQFPQLKIQIIENLKYEEYKRTISKAKWALTFGEGLDGYFVETIFSGGISFSIYNPAFFTKDFKSLRTVYDNYNTLTEQICLDIKNLDNERDYTHYQNRQYELCRKYYGYEEYVKNLELFYKGEYTYK